MSAANQQAKLGLVFKKKCQIMTRILGRNANNDSNGGVGTDETITVSESEFRFDILCDTGC